MPSYLAWPESRTELYCMVICTWLNRALHTELQHNNPLQVCSIYSITLHACRMHVHLFSLLHGLLSYRTAGFRWRGQRSPEFQVSAHTHVAVAHLQRVLRALPESRTRKLFRSLSCWVLIHLIFNPLNQTWLTVLRACVHCSFGSWVKKKHDVCCYRKIIYRWPSMFYSYYLMLWSILGSNLFVFMWTVTNSHYQTHS